MTVTRQARGVTAAQTHSAVLDLVRSGGVVSRVELADRSGLTEASISRIVRQLITDGLVAEIGTGDRTGGKRRTLLQLNAQARHAVGVSLDFARITYLVSDLGGDVVARLDAEGIGVEPPGEIVPRIAAELDEVVAAAGVDRSTLMGVGVAAAGRQDAAHHVLRSNPTADDWEEFDIEDALSSATGLPVVVENDSTCAAIGEFWVGRIPASADFATVYLATGFGLGFVTNGDVYRGTSSNVGEIGHMVLDVDGPPCWCGSQGCLEVLGTPARVVELAIEQGLAEDLGLRGEPAAAREDFDRVARAAVGRHPQALALVQRSARYLSRVLLSVTNLLDLDHIILAGPGFGVAGEIYLRQAQADLERLSFVRDVHPTTVELSRSSDVSAALGAASLVLHSRLTPHQTSSRLALTAP